MILVKNQIHDKVWRQSLNQVKKQVSSEDSSQAHYKIRIPVWNCIKTINYETN